MFTEKYWSLSVSHSHCPSVSYRGVALFLQKLLVPLSLAVFPSRMHHCFYQMFHGTFFTFQKIKVTTWFLTLLWLYKMYYHLLMQYCFGSDQQIHPFRSENVEPFRCFSPLWLLLGSMNEEQRLFTHVMWIQNFIMNIIIKNRQKFKSKLFIIIYILAFLSKLVHPLRVQSKVRNGLTILVLQLLNLYPYCTVTIECKESIITSGSAIT